MKKQLITLVIILLSISVNSQSWWNSKAIKGNGNVVTKTRSINSFDEVNLGGSFNVNLVDGKEGKLTIEAEENLLPYIKTYVKNGVLRIKFKENTNIRTTKKLVVTVPFQSIEGVSLGGSGNINVKKTINSDAVSFNIGGSGNITASLNTNSVKASIGGSGNIRLKGKTSNFKCSIAGSGNVKAYNLSADNLKANIAGSGSIQTTVKSNIKANVVGSGSVYYKGNPNKIDTNSIGSGDVIDKN